MWQFQGRYIIELAVQILAMTVSLGTGKYISKSDTWISFLHDGVQGGGEERFEKREEEREDKKNRWEQEEDKGEEVAAMCFMDLSQKAGTL